MQYQFVTILQQLMSEREQTAESNHLNVIMFQTGRSINETRMAAAGRLSFDLVALIQQQIETNKFEVNEVQKDFKLKNKQNKEEAKRNNDSLNKRYQHDDGQNTKDEDHHSLHNNYNEKKYYKSEMTQQDVDKIKKIKFLQKKYDLQLENKVKLYEESLKKFHDEEKELLEKQKRQKNEERLKEVAKNIEQIRNRQEERKRKMQEEKKRLMEIKNQKKLYERLDEQYKGVQMQQQRKKEQMKLALKVQKNIHFDEIKEHQKKYDQIMRSQREQREKKLGQLVRGNSKKYYQSRLLKDFIQTEEKAKIQHIEKKNELKQHMLKKQQYAQYVRNNYRPALPAKDEQQQQSRVHIQTHVLPASRSISVHELHKLGNDYMKQVHENVQNLKGSSVSKIEKKEEPFKYKDYLQQIKAERKPSSQKESRYLQQIDSLLKKENMTQEEKFYKAKILAQKIEAKKGRDSQKLIESINAKIHLLKHIEPQ